MSDIREVILVGHCGPDAHMLRSAVRRAVPHARVTLVNEERRLRDHRSSNALLLINRMLDGDFLSDSGLALIKSLLNGSNANAVPQIMLISNFTDAQDHAVTAGALRGFGKSQLYSDTTRDMLRAAIVVQRESDEAVPA